MALSTRSTGVADATRNVGAPNPPRDEPDPAGGYQEVTLADVVRVLHRRKLVLAGALVTALIAGTTLTILTTPQFVVEAAVIPLAHEDVMGTWLSSRQAAEAASDDVGARLYPVLFPDRWDAEGGTWKSPATREEIGVRLSKHVDIRPGGTVSAGALVLNIVVKLPDALLARDVAAAYVGTLDDLRPQLENITRSELFDAYYDGTNGQEAQRRAETAAAQRTYWIVFDTPTVPAEPSEPRPIVNMAIATSVGLFGGVVLAFALEWLARYRAEFERVDSPRQ